MRVHVETHLGKTIRHSSFGMRNTWRLQPTLDYLLSWIYLSAQTLSCSHAFCLISPNLLLPSIDPHTSWIDLSSICTSLVELLFYCTTSDNSLQSFDYSTTQTSQLSSTNYEISLLLTHLKKLMVIN